MESEIMWAGIDEDYRLNSHNAYAFERRLKYSSEGGNIKRKREFYGLPRIEGD